VTIAGAAGLAGCVTSSGSPGDGSPGYTADGGVSSTAASNANAFTPTADAARTAAASQAADALTSVAKPGNSAYKIGPADTLDIQVFKVPDLAKTVQVAENGDINFPLVGDLQAAGKTAHELERDLTRRLGAKYLRDPHVTVLVREYNSQRVTVSGAVKSSGVYPIKGSTSLMQVVAMAGDVDTATDSGNVVIFRAINGQRSAARFDIDAIRAGRAEDPQVQNATWLSLLSLLPPLAVLCSAVQLTLAERRLMSLGIIGFGSVSVVLGLAQLAQGPASSLRFFSFTNTEDAVGFFANRNHFAAFLYCVVLFAAAWGIDVIYRLGSWRALKEFVLSPKSPLLAIVIVFICLLIGEAFVRSRAGLILTMVALLGIFPLAFADQAEPIADRKSGKLLVVATLFCIVLIVQFALYRVISRCTVDMLQDARVVLARNTLDAAKAFFPFGSGLGSFVQVYGMFEKPADVFVDTFANHAHDDFLELLLETGLAGVALVLAFLLWLGRSAARHWWRPRQHAGLTDRSLARAGSVAIVLLLVHSFVDYPLRTEALMAIFAFSCALLIEPLGPAHADSNSEASQKAGQSPERQNSVLPIVEPVGQLSKNAPAAPSALQAIVPWGGDIEWPDDWRS
jgi:protein involved in polysaccharide export with SLBB domain